MESWRNNTFDHNRGEEFEIESNPAYKLLKCKTANKWIAESQQSEVPRQLFGCFWFEGELCVLFADTNLGKSILAVQIADSISRGVPILNLSNEAERQRVLYFDFELSKKQFEARYTEKIGMDRRYENPYLFDDFLIRAEYDQEAAIPAESSFEDLIMEAISNQLKSYKARVLIIDNITYLKNETEKAKDALPLMRQLKALKSKYELSILALAHTPKRDLSKPITRNDLSGSKMIINFVDSCFAIGESHSDKNTRYLKQIKARNCEIKYDQRNVMSCQIVKKENFLGFEFLSESNEAEHLKAGNLSDRESRNQTIKELHAEGKTQREIAEQLNVSLGTINRCVNL